MVEGFLPACIAGLVYVGMLGGHTFCDLSVTRQGKAEAGDTFVYALEFELAFVSTQTI